MILRMVKKDFLRNKATILTLFLFIVLSSLFASAGSCMAAELTRSVKYLLEKAEVPHFIQMHTGEINRAAVEKFISGSNYVKEAQIVEMLSMGNRNIMFNSKEEKGQNDIMDISLIRQNEKFDFLLNLDNNPVSVERGKIAVPVYYMQKEKLKKGDKIRIQDGDFSTELIISDFIRDAQMNSAIIHSKRFVINEEDFKNIKNRAGKREESIEFQINDIKNLRNFAAEYSEAGFGLNGPVVDYNLFILLNAITDGIIIAAVMSVSVIINIVALLCLSFTVLASLEEDYCEIGTMKAIGMQNKDIKKIYTAKYGVITALGCVLGYFLSLTVKDFLISHINLYMGKTPSNVTEYILAAFVSLTVFLIIMLFCMLILRKFRKISAVEALRTGVKDKRKNWGIKLKNFRVFSTDIFLGIKDILVRFKLYRILFLIFFISSFLVIVPVNFLNTIKSPSFIVYTGAAESDIRIDIQQGENMESDYEKIMSYAENDRDIADISPVAAERVQIMDNEGNYEDIDIETGDFTKFQAEYIKGKAPLKNGEIALSYLNSRETGKNPGDKIILKINGSVEPMIVTGIYQDITNGGKTAKAVINNNVGQIQRYVININLRNGVETNRKIAEYKKLFTDVKITYPEEYMNQTMGETIKHLETFTLIVTAASAGIVILMTSLFIKMLLSKDKSEIYVLRKIGLSVRNIRIQYIVRMTGVIIPGILFGSIAANTAGQKITGFMWSFLGAAEIKFVIDPVKSYILCPVLLTVIVVITTMAATDSVKKFFITK
ncbi:FtsX-like permease family protein [Sebaldella sp. S0638]|uniref:ABC transporter permease n=1 Tax=Sebaldella sp. S0638 TaxID=2957809 RepID=UPI00209F4316|nr:FtsX-like permease family protein [Sebaldella sp. S0638]MCP1223170.1 FtsX-like permease family protein [Sebaldella sp. S0638]